MDNIRAQRLIGTSKISQASPHEKTKALDELNKWIASGEVDTEGRLTRLLAAALRNEESALDTAGYGDIIF